MRRVFTLMLIIIACASQMFAQLSILNEQGDEITGTTINVQAGVTTDIYFKVKNNGTSDLSNVKAYLRVNDENVTPGQEANATMCTEPGGNCGIPPHSPKFSLAAGAEQLIHLNITTLSATDFVVTIYPSGGSPEANFNIHATTSGISSIVANTFSVYPSPANESFTIENGFGKNSYVEIYNVLGQTVKRIPSDNASNISVNCSTWKNGYYVCRLYKDGKAEKTVKVVVAH
ncbi:MAG: T9SS type A sorting domain-containing protein [Bacteroidales bacterium]|nr:T9SS type A sorting domain-containing protein [Bacteroidales bacterium]